MTSQREHSPAGLRPGVDVTDPTNVVSMPDGLAAELREHGLSSPVRAQTAPGRWAEVERLRYKAEGSAPFRDITRQLLFQDEALACELRYFEVEPGGYSTLERHEHAHAVMVQRGRGRVLVGDRVFDLNEHDLVHIPAMTWHQFRAPDDAPLGFLCMVNRERDRPQLPTADDLEALHRNATVAAFIRG